MAPKKLSKHYNCSMIADTGALGSSQNGGDAKGFDKARKMYMKMLTPIILSKMLLSVNNSASECTFSNLGKWLTQNTE
jgi:hypothetical protein